MPLWLISIGRVMLGGLTWLRDLALRVPWFAWVIFALGVVLILSRLDLGDTREREQRLLTWQGTVIDHASDAFGTPQHGKPPPRYAAADIPLVLDAAGIALKSWKDAVAEQNATLLANKAKGDAAAADSHAAAQAFDKGKTTGRTPAQLRDIKPAAKPDTAGAEAVELGREEWSALR